MQNQNQQPEPYVRTALIIFAIAALLVITALLSLPAQS